MNLRFIIFIFLGFMELPYTMEENKGPSSSYSKKKFTKQKNQGGFKPSYKKEFQPQIDESQYPSYNNETSQSFGGYNGVTSYQKDYQEEPYNIKTSQSFGGYKNFPQKNQGGFKPSYKKEFQPQIDESQYPSYNNETSQSFGGYNGVTSYQKDYQEEPYNIKTSQSFGGYNSVTSYQKDYQGGFNESSYQNQFKQQFNQPPYQKYPQQKQGYKEKSQKQYFDGQKNYPQQDQEVFKQSYPGLKVNKEAIKPQSLIAKNHIPQPQSLDSQNNLPQQKPNETEPKFNQNSKKNLLTEPVNESIDTKAIQDLKNNKKERKSSSSSSQRSIAEQSQDGLMKQSNKSIDTEKAFAQNDDVYNSDFYNGFNSDYADKVNKKTLSKQKNKAKKTDENNDLKNFLNNLEEDGLSSFNGSVSPNSQSSAFNKTSNIFKSSNDFKAKKNRGKNPQQKSTKMPSYFKDEEQCKMAMEKINGINLTLFPSFGQYNSLEDIINDAHIKEKLFLEKEQLTLAKKTLIYFDEYNPDNEDFHHSDQNDSSNEQISDSEESLPDDHNVFEKPQWKNPIFFNPDCTMKPNYYSDNEDNLLNTSMEPLYDDKEGFSSLINIKEPAIFTGDIEEIFTPKRPRLTDYDCPEMYFYHYNQLNVYREPVYDPKIKSFSLINIKPKGKLSKRKDMAVFQHKFSPDFSVDEVFKSCELFFYFQLLHKEVEDSKYMKEQKIKNIKKMYNHGYSYLSDTSEEESSSEDSRDDIYFHDSEDSQTYKYKNTQKDNQDNGYKCKLYVQNNRKLDNIVQGKEEFDDSSSVVSNNPDYANLIKNNMKFMNSSNNEPILYLFEMSNMFENFNNQLKNFYDFLLHQQTLRLNSDCSWKIKRQWTLYDLSWYRSNFNAFKALGNCIRDPDNVNGMYFDQTKTIIGSMLFLNKSLKKTLRQDIKTLEQCQKNLLQYKNMEPNNLSPFKRWVKFNKKSVNSFKDFSFNVEDEEDWDCNIYINQAKEVIQSIYDPQQVRQNFSPYKKMEPNNLPIFKKIEHLKKPSPLRNIFEELSMEFIDEIEEDLNQKKDFQLVFKKVEAYKKFLEQKDVPKPLIKHLAVMGKMLKIGLIKKEIHDILMESFFNKNEISKKKTQDLSEDNLKKFRDKLMLSSYHLKRLRADNLKGKHIQYIVKEQKIGIIWNVINKTQQKTWDYKSDDFISKEEVTKIIKKHMPFPKAITHIYLPPEGRYLDSDDINPYYSLLKEKFGNMSKLNKPLTQEEYQLYIDFNVSTSYTEPWIINSDLILKKRAIDDLWKLLEDSDKKISQYENTTNKLSMNDDKLPPQTLTQLILQRIKKYKNQVAENKILTDKYNKINHYDNNQDQLVTINNYKKIYNNFYAIIEIIKKLLNKIENYQKFLEIDKSCPIRRDQFFKNFTKNFYLIQQFFPNDPVSLLVIKSIAFIFPNHDISKSLYSKKWTKEQESLMITSNIVPILNKNNELSINQKKFIGLYLYDKIFFDHIAYNTKYPQETLGKKKIFDEIMEPIRIFIGKCESQYHIKANLNDIINKLYDDFLLERCIEIRKFKIGSRPLDNCDMIHQTSVNFKVIKNISINQNNQNQDPSKKDDNEIQEEEKKDQKQPKKQIQQTPSEEEKNKLLKFFNTNAISIFAVNNVIHAQVNQLFVPSENYDCLRRNPEIFQEKQKQTFKDDLTKFSNMFLKLMLAEARRVADPIIFDLPKFKDSRLIHGNLETIIRFQLMGVLLLLIKHYWIGNLQKEFENSSLSAEEQNTILNQLISRIDALEKIDFTTIIYYLYRNLTESYEIDERKIRKEELDYNKRLNAYYN